MSEAEIKPCFRCGGQMQEMCFGVGTQYVHCAACLYASVAKPTIEEAIAAHAALYARARVGELVTELQAEYDVGLSSNEGLALVTLIPDGMGEIERAEAPTLLAALESLAEQVRGE